jgi:hypothetical protein
MGQNVDGMNAGNTARSALGSEGQDIGTQRQWQHTRSSNGTARAKE